MSVLEINTIVFDAAGTLVHPALPIGRTYATVAAGFGLTLDPEQIHQSFTQAFQKLQNRPMGTVPRNGDDRAWWREVVRLTLSDARIAKDFPFEAFFEKLYLTYENPSRWKLFSEVEEVLQTLFDRGFQMAILSNWDDRIHAVLEGLYLTPFFNEVFVSGELGVAKPNPAIYHEVQEVMRRKPKELLMVGDDPVCDFEAPQMLGWNALLLKRPDETLQNLLDYLMV